MTFDDPGDGIFDHLDDPTPPLHGGDALTHVMQRGQQIRRRRRSIYSVEHRVVVIAVAGIADRRDPAGHSSGGNESVTPLKSPTSSSVAPLALDQEAGLARAERRDRDHQPGRQPHHSGGGGSMLRSCRRSA